MLEYHFFIRNIDNSITFLIIDNHEDYLYTIEELKFKKEVVYFNVIKGVEVFNSNLY